MTRANLPKFKTVPINMFYNVLNMHGVFQQN